MDGDLLSDGFPISAEPHTGWLANTLQRDDRDFLLTGRDLLRDRRPPPGWPLDRPPLPLETSLPGVFAAGDVRHGSIKRVAAAVGEGATAIQFAGQYLDKTSATSPLISPHNDPSVRLYRLARRPPSACISAVTRALHVGPPLPSVSAADWQGPLRMATDSPR